MSEFIKRLAADLYMLFRRAHWSLKAICLLLVIVVVFLGGRCGFMGDGVKTALWSVVTQEMLFDCAQPTLLVSLGFEVLEDGEFVVGKQDATYPSGTQVRLKAGANRRCWLLLFGVDRKGFHAVFPREDIIEAARYDPENGLSPIAFRIDNTAGAEVYMIVASRDRFDAAEVRALVLRQAAEVDFGRGPSLDARFDLPSGLVYDAVSFRNSGG